MNKTEIPCKCGTPWRDFDNRCLRCKKTIEDNRANSLEFHRKLSEIAPCKCSDTSIENWGKRTTLVEGLLLCNFCDLKIGNFVDEAQQKAAKEEMVRQKAHQEAFEAKIMQEVSRIVEEAKSGKSIYLYRSVYVSVDSFTDFGGQISQLAPFNDVDVRIAGLNGWRVISSIPKTAGSTLQNYEGFGKAWAGGIGGTVVGAYVIMEYEINAKNVQSSRDLIEQSVRPKSSS